MSRIQVSETLYLSRITRNDKAAYLQHLADEEISRNTLAVPFPYTEADADSRLEQCETQACEPEKLFAIRESTGHLIGSIGIAGELPTEAKSAEFGYWLAKPYRGRGVMTQAIITFADHCFDRLGFDYLYAIPFLSNLASQRALAKAGFQREALLPQYRLKDGVYIDSVRYGKVRSSRR